jgi:hypothetical protein
MNQITQTIIHSFGKYGKYFTIIFFISFTLLYSNEKIDDFNYFENDFFIKFENRKILYHLPSTGCMANFAVFGYGSYEINYRKNVISVRIEKYPLQYVPSKSSYQKLDSSSLKENQFRFKFIDNFGNPVECAVVSYQEKDGNFAGFNPSSDSLDFFISSENRPVNSKFYIQKYGNYPLVLDIQDNIKGNYLIVLEKGDLCMRDSGGKENIHFEILQQQSDHNDRIDSIRVNLMNNPKKIVLKPENK